MLVERRVEGCSLSRFEAATGLKLTTNERVKDDLPPISTFLNRLLALTIALQNILFGVFEELIATRVQGAIASGTHDVRLETLQADSFLVRDRWTIYTHLATGAETRLLTIVQKVRNRPISRDAGLDHRRDPRAIL